MDGALCVGPEASRRDRRAFLTLPYRLYRHHPFWVPPLRLAEAATFDRRKNPFFRHAEVAHFLARRGNRVVGRIAAIENRLHNEVHRDRLGFFGFFDVEPDPEAAAALVREAAAWVAGRGLVRMRGPVNYSTNDPCGVLVDGFDRAPLVLMPWNRPDYDPLLLQAGCTPAKDLLAWWITHDRQVPERFRRAVERRLEGRGVRLRPIDLRDVRGEIRRLEPIYNRCWADNWGYVPATAEEFEHAASHLQILLEPDLSAVAEIRGEPVGLSFVLRDLNVVLRGTSGRLTPWTLLRMLYGLPRVRHVRVLALGVVPEARGRGINEAFFLRAADTALAKGIHAGEAGWILEDNERMVAPILAVGGVPHKRYRLYEREVGS